MNNSSLFSETVITDRGKRALDRLKEVFSASDLPAGWTAFAASDNGINDLYMNLNRQLGEGKLERKTKLLIAVAVASAKGSADAVQFFGRAAVASGRTAIDVMEAIGAATTCSMFNGYYRFKDQIPEEDRATFEAFKAPFNANVFVKPALSLLENEAICIAVSSLNGCHKCVAGHIAKGKTVGLTDEQIDEIIRAGAAAAAAAQVALALGTPFPTAR